MDTDMRGTLEERAGDASPGVALGTAGASGTEERGRKDGTFGSASAGSVFSSFSWSGAASLLAMRPQSRRHTDTWSSCDYNTITV